MTCISLPADHGRLEPLHLLRVGSAELHRGGSALSDDGDSTARESSPGDALRSYGSAAGSSARAEALSRDSLHRSGVSGPLTSRVAPPRRDLILSRVFWGDLRSRNPGTLGGPHSITPILTLPQSGVIITLHAVSTKSEEEICTHIFFGSSPRALVPAMSSSLGYAERLSWRNDLGGQLGDPEQFDGGPADKDPKVLELIRLVREAKASWVAAQHACIRCRGGCVAENECPVAQ